MFDSRSRVISLRGRARAALSALRRRTWNRGPRARDAGPHLVHAGVPDGETLWVAVAAGPTEVLGIQDVETGETTELTTETDRGDASLRTARQPLLEDGVPRFAEDTRLVVLGEGRSCTPVQFRPTSSERGRIPRTATGEWRFHVVNVAGALHVQRRAEPPAASVLRVDGSSSLDVWFELPDDVPPVVLGVTAEGESVGQVECPGEGGERWLHLTDETIPTAPGESVQLVVGPDHRLPLVRNNDDLKFPNSSVLLPSLDTDDPEGRPGLTLRYKGDGSLVLARPKPNAEAAR